MALSHAMTLFACTLSITHSAEMHCGNGVPLCGVLALQTGLGSGAYESQATKVHGLWPQAGRYGTSKCVQPEDTTNPTKIYDCYAGDSSDEHALWFENHEWTRHGQCAGAKDVDDFFGQVCSISREPLDVLEKAKESGSNFQSMADALKDHGYPVFSLDHNHDQVMLSACAGDDGRWVLADISEMPSKCAGSSQPEPSPVSTSCSLGKQGPPCSSDDDCINVDGCVACGDSGYCMAQQLVNASNSAEYVQV